MNNEKANKLLADVRALTVELHDGELTDRDHERIQLMVDIFRQIRADGAPDYPIVEYVKNCYGSEKDNDGQTVIYLDDAPDHSERCPSCGEPYEVEVEDGADCLECVAGREDPDDDPYIARSYLGRQVNDAQDAHRKDPDRQSVTRDIWYNAFAPGYICPSCHYEYEKQCRDGQPCPACRADLDKMPHREV